MQVRICKKQGQKNVVAGPAADGAGVKVTVITLCPDNTLFGDPADICEMICEMKQAGVTVALCESENEHYAVIDHKLVWHGSMNLLGREDLWDNLIRVENVKVAAELMEMSKNNVVVQELTRS